MRLIRKTRQPNVKNYLPVLSIERVKRVGAASIKLRIRIVELPV